MSGSLLTAMSGELGTPHHSDGTGTDVLPQTSSVLPETRGTMRIGSGSFRQPMDALFEASGLVSGHTVTFLTDALDSERRGVSNADDNGNNNPSSQASEDDEQALALLQLTKNGVGSTVERRMFTLSASPSPADSDEDDTSRFTRRPRSVSNPEGMEKWDSYSQRSRRHFVLPAAILEEELAEVSAAIQERERVPKSDLDLSGSNKHLQRRGKPHSEEDDESSKVSENEEDEDEEEVNEDDLAPDDLLKRARSRLFEDLSESNAYSNKGALLILPHSLTKYKNVYNKNGRIGIYTPKERQAIIARYQSKRSRRNWNKKIRYNCRKSLADRRLRVKGRFVKRSEQEKLLKEIEMQKENGGCTGDELMKDMSTTDSDMPDIDDPEAGFCPTEDLPYRRLRRHTIT